MSMLRGLLGLLLLTITVAVAVIAWDVHEDLRGGAATLQHADDLISDVSVDLAFKSEQIGHILTTSRLIADETGLLVLEQRRQLAKTSADSDKSVKALRLTLDRAGLLLKHTDEQLNLRTLPQITTAIGTNAARIGHSADVLAMAGNSLNARFRDPQLDAMLASFNQAAASLTLMSAAGDSSMNHVDHILAYADKQLTTPIGFWKNLLLHEALPAVGSAGSFAAGFVRK